MPPLTTYTVSPGWQILLRDMGLPVRPVLRRAGLPDDLFSRGTTRISATHFHALCESLEVEATGHELPLLLARSLSVEAFEPPLFAALCSEDLNRAAARIAIYKPLIGPMQLDIGQGEGGPTLGFVWPQGIVPPRVLGLTELMFWVSLARLATRVALRPTHVTVMELPDDPAPYREYLGIDLVQGERWAVGFSELDARRPFLTANEGMWQFFEPGLRKRLAELEVGASTAERVKATLLELLPAGEATMSVVARRLAMSTRTLQRRLTRENASFQSLLASIREALARHYLTNSLMPAAEISFLLGYEDPNSFYRAFHTWTGQTPETVRAATR